MTATPSDYIKDARGIAHHDAACPQCSGSGIKLYGSTATWRGGIGGAAMTNDVCDKCWGSGTTNPWPSHRDFYNMQRAQGGKVTGNSSLLLGYIMGAVNGADAAMYKAATYDADSGQCTVRHSANGNKYNVTVRQTHGDGME